MTYGRYPYGGLAYGGSDVAEIPNDALPALAVEVAFTTNALSTPAWVDITGDVREWDTTRGRNRELERFQPGRATIVLDNLSRQYDSSNAAGPWFGNLKPMRRVRIRQTFNGVTYPVFDGFVDKWQLDYPQHGKDATATITATDAFKIFARTDLPRSVYTTTVDDDAPVVWWRLDDLAYSTTALSAIGTAKDGEVVGGPDFQVESLVVHDNGTAMATPKDTENPSDKGIELDLSDASLTVNGGTPLAFEFWLRRKPNNAASGSGGLENYAFLTNSAGSITPVRFGLFISNADDSKLKWHAVNDAETSEWGVRSNFALALDTTYHIAAVHGSDRVLRLYINGVDVSEASPGTAGSTTSGTITADEMKFMERGTINTADAVVDEFAFYLGTIPSLTDFAAHNTAGRAPWNADLPGARLDRVLDLVEWPDDLRELDDGATALQSATLNTAALEHLQKVSETEFGLLFVDRAGNVRFVARSAVFARTAAAGAVFGDGAGEIGYRGIKFDDGDEVIRNRATITQLNGVPAVEENTASVTEFGRFDYDLSGLYHDSLTHSEDYAEFIVAEYKDPRRRVISLTLGPAELGAEADLYPQMLGRELGDAIVVKNQPPGGGSAFSQTCVIEGIRHRSAPGPGSGTRGHLTTTWILSPEYTNEF